MAKPPKKFIDYIKGRAPNYPEDKMDDIWLQEIFQQGSRDDATDFQEKTQVGDWLDDWQDFAPFTLEGLKKRKFK